MPVSTVSPGTGTAGRSHARRREAERVISSSSRGECSTHCGHRLKFLLPAATTSRLPLQSPRVQQLPSALRSTRKMVVPGASWQGGSGRANTWCAVRPAARMVRPRAYRQLVCVLGCLTHGETAVSEVRSPSCSPLRAGMGRRLEPSARAAEDACTVLSLRRPRHSHAALYVLHGLILALRAVLRRGR